MTGRAIAIYNPTARGAPPLERLRDALTTLDGWETSLESTTGTGHATALARQAVQRGLDAVVACGGDGTLNEVANGLVGSETAMATVRGGTANVWAKEIAAPRDITAAVRLLADGERLTVDLGRAGDRYFLLMAGIGFDAEIVHRVSPGLKRRFGAAAYLWPGLLRAFRHRSAQTEIVQDSKTQPTPLYWLLLGNTRSYAGVLNLTHMAKADDSLLDYCLLKHGGPLRLAWLALWALLRRHQNRAEVVYEKVGSLEIRTPGLAVQIDGEYLSETPMTFGVAKGALTVIVPPGLKSPLFGG